MTTYRAEKIVRIPKNADGSSASHFNPGEEIPESEIAHLKSLGAGKLEEAVKAGLISVHETHVDLGKPAPAHAGKQK